jgi:hypothetical protein
LFHVYKKTKKEIFKRVKIKITMRRETRMNSIQMFREWRNLGIANHIYDDR